MKKKKPADSTPTPDNPDHGDRREPKSDFERQSVVSAQVELLRKLAELTSQQLRK